jgi:ribulose-5-phosphate 4-epimerase/fuculose-1-phosphate aldolase
MPRIQIGVAEDPDANEHRLRVDLAAAFRIAASLAWHESVGNHFSLALSDDGRQFLMNRRWQHFGSIKARDLQVLDCGDRETLSRPDAPDPSAWYIHSHLHARIRKARCILHLHPPFATALSTLADPTLKPIDQNTARFYGRIAQTVEYGGIADEDREGARLAAALGEHRVLMMGNHGILVTAETVPEAFEDLYFLERACQTLVLAYSTGQELRVMPPELAERTARGWDKYKQMALAHFDALKQGLDRAEPEYAS